VWPGPPSPLPRSHQQEQHADCHLEPVEARVIAVGVVSDADEEDDGSAHEDQTRDHPNSGPSGVCANHAGDAPRVAFAGQHLAADAVDERLGTPIIAFAAIQGVTSSRRARVSAAISSASAAV